MYTYVYIYCMYKYRYTVYIKVHKSNNVFADEFKNFILKYIFDSLIVSHKIIIVYYLI